MQNPDVLNVMNSLGIFGKSPLLMEAVNAAVQVAPYDVTVLVTGENGSGKDFFYKILHNGSHRRHKKFIAVNCGGLPEGTIDSELFGHVKGAYTGSTGDRKGYFEEADGGTIFLDEVGDLPMAIQAKLLRVLEKGEIIRMGSNEVRNVDVRIVAATNVDLQKAIKEGKFREDLYYRLSTIRIRVPSLRERREDIDLLFRKFASDIANKYRMATGIRLDDDARRMLCAYDWPGNVRQLLHVVEAISIVETDRIIGTDILQKYLPHFESGMSVGGGGATGEGGSAFGIGEKEMLYKLLFEMKRELEEVRAKLGMHTTTSMTPRKPLELTAGTPITDAPMPVRDVTHTPTLEEVEEITGEEVNPDSEVTTPTLPAEERRPLTMEEIEKRAIMDALTRNNGNRRKAADELKISERTMHRKIKDYGLE